MQCGNVHLASLIIAPISIDRRGWHMWDGAEQL
jgi:hypothetical protein